ncbi:GNAT family N-acetyltransferase [Inquilinus sp. Marseille-Q2685]|uniref:GNAT family N-acetyltransferase n=1 Tax=Inquilinus sp. Marseille-Q2685 TaxID=2866581 RepID=UPI001CE410F0|nr:GNAT family N-acetyltransferase [Inquilinus sp. Marseille-Q2685]
MNAERFKIRTAIEEDLGAIARVLVDTWRTTFRGRLPNEFLDSMSYSHQEDRHGRMMRRPGTSYFVAVVEPQLEVVGFANGGPSRQKVLPQAGELYAIYIRDAYHGRGIGKRLFRAVVAEHRRHEREGMFVWVLADNPNRGFYERLGGRQAAQRPITLGSATVPEIAYAWDDLRSM